MEHSARQRRCTVHVVLRETGRTEWDAVNLPGYLPGHVHIPAGEGGVSADVEVGPLAEVVALPAHVRRDGTTPRRAGREHQIGEDQRERSGKDDRGQNLEPSEVLRATGHRYRLLIAHWGGTCGLHNERQADERGEAHTQGKWHAHHTMK